VPFLTKNVLIDLALRKALEPNDSLGNLFAQGSVCGFQRDGRDDAVAAAGQQGETSPRGHFILCLGQDAPSASDDGISGKDEGSASCNCQRLFARHASGIGARHFGFVRSFVDIGSSAGLVTRQIRTGRDRRGRA
jgi:hypothetical protein